MARYHDRMDDMLAAPDPKHLQGTFVVYLQHQDGQVPASATTAGGLGACNKGGFLPLGAGLVEDEEGPHVCSALQGLSSAVVTASKVQASKMPWDPHARPQSLFCTSD
ncbi:hypothetical protein KCU92_g160, partial [Aureobasidium melanogenum]